MKEKKCSQFIENIYAQNFRKQTNKQAQVQRRQWQWQQRYICMFTQCTELRKVSMKSFFLPPNNEWEKNDRWLFNSQFQDCDYV